MRVAAEADGREPRGRARRAASRIRSSAAIASAALSEGADPARSARSTTCAGAEAPADHREDLVRPRRGPAAAALAPARPLARTAVPAGSRSIVWLAELAASSRGPSRPPAFASPASSWARSATGPAAPQSSSARSAARRCPGAGAARAARLRRAHRRASSSPRPPASSALIRFKSPARRRRPDPGLLGQPDATPRPRRQPPAQLRPAPDRGHPGTRASARSRFLARKQAEGKSRMEALRALKRHLARAVWHALRAARDRDQLPLSF